MLNHEKLFEQLAQTTESFFTEYASEQVIAQRLWELIADDNRFEDQVAQKTWPYLVPRWQGALTYQEPIVHQQNAEYSVFAVDGSQIYPDRHQGVACYLINIGTVVLSYSKQPEHSSYARLHSQPYLMAHNSEYDTEHDSFELLPEVVNCQRTEFEFRAGVALSKEYTDALFLFDGSLIFWHLDSKDITVKNRFLKSYCDALQRLYETRTLHAGYISLPKSRELVNLVRIASELSQYNPLGAPFIGRYLVDIDIVRMFLKPHHRTRLFENQSPIVSLYPPHLRPYFFYMHVGVEIVRIEVPAWIAHDAQLAEKVATLILNQALKGNGYPVCLAEAHEQAVVSNADRELFYAMLQKIMHQKNVTYPVSQKSMHKRSLGI